MQRESSPGRFRDRTDAGRALAAAVVGRRAADGIVYGIPRGGVPVAIEVARRLALRLECAVVRRIAHPLRSSRTAAVVTETGDPLLNPQELGDVDAEWLRRRVLEERREARRCRLRYAAGRPAAEATHKLAILVDDFAVSGLSLRALARALQAQRPARLVIAVPCAAAGATEVLAQEADELIVLVAGAAASVPGGCYETLPELDDEQVMQLLRDWV